MAMGLHPVKEGPKRISVPVRSIPVMAEVASIIYQQFDVRGTFIIPWEFRDEGGEIVYDGNLLGSRYSHQSEMYTQNSGLPEPSAFNYVV
jgi:hypothetical protein